MIKRKLSDFLTNSVTVAFAVGIILAISFSPVLDGEQQLIKWLKEWQTIVAGCLALIAARWTVGVVLDQIKSQENLFREQLKRKERTARAHMAEALSCLLGYSKRCLFYLLSDENEAFPKPSEAETKAIDVFKNAHEALDDKAFIAVNKLTSFYQIYNARLRSYEDNNLIQRDRVDNPESWKERVCDTLVLGHLIISLFDYARGAEPPEEKSWPTKFELIQALKNIVGAEEFFYSEDNYKVAIEIANQRGRT